MAQFRSLDFTLTGRNYFLNLLGRIQIITHATPILATLIGLQ